MKWTLITCILLLSSLSQAQVGSDNTKTIIKDNGAREKEKLDAVKLCQDVRDEQQRLMVMVRPEFQGQITVKEAIPLEVFRADNSLGYAAKCVLLFPIK